MSFSFFIPIPTMRVHGRIKATIFRLWRSHVSLLGWAGCLVSISIQVQQFMHRPIQTHVKVLFGFGEEEWIFTLQLCFVPIITSEGREGTPTLYCTLMYLIVGLFCSLCRRFIGNSFGLPILSWEGEVPFP
jgi:hypothetical protein